MDVKKVLAWKRSTDNRPTWNGDFDFLMSCISTSVGFGNVWRFPFTAYENGGGAFLVPYVAILILVGRPMYYMETLIGQFANRNNVRIWVLNPGFKGVGLGQLIATGSILSYYVYLMAITLDYTLQSFSSELPWAMCKAEWGNVCVSAIAHDQNMSGGRISSSELHFLKDVIHVADDIESGLGYPDWKLTIALFVSWATVFFVMRNFRSNEKSSYFLVIFPHVILLIILIRSLTLPGAKKGILFFITPEWSAIYDPCVWFAAVTQAFYSLCVAEGPIIMLSSYNSFNHRVKRDNVIVSIVDTFTSFLAGLTIFGIIGNLAYSLGSEDVGDVISSGGVGLAFITYPNAIAQFDWVPQIFGVSFFSMLFVLGLGTAVSMQSAIVTVMADRFSKQQYWRLAFLACSVGFLSGMLYVTPGGQHMLTVVDRFGGTFLLLGMAIFELCGIFWFYGLENFCEDIQFMKGRKVKIYQRLCLGLLTPCIMITAFVHAFIYAGPLKYAKKEMPYWIHVFGWGLLFIGLALVPTFMVVAYFKNGRNFKNIFKADKKWGPSEEGNKKEWIEYKKEARRVEKSYGNSKPKHILYSLFGLYEKPCPTRS